MEQITEVSHDSRIAKLVRSDVNWTTEPRCDVLYMFLKILLTFFRDYTDVDPSRTLRIREIRGSPHVAYYGSKLFLKRVTFRDSRSTGIDLMTLVFGTT